MKQISQEVFYSNGDFLAVDSATITLLRENAARSPRRRCRLCFHADAASAQQEMLIVMHRSSYVRPHRHFGKVETLGIVEGACDALLFDEAGNVTRTINMSPAADGGSFFYRMPDRVFHTLRFRSEWLTFIETTIGPFDPAATEAATWAPPETDPVAGHAFLANLAKPAI
ncbi:WbuC family cupin fold metalloprotein [Phreatobacter stygius]|uniref:WbuC family cupin fold metalloprotein n=1 Tax=Phreatobacter stygius TaxID=1940610 RepID=UPI00147763B1|nr:WbuC family cupin fold metalloprotein [Phreatobacter stygius]